MGERRKRKSMWDVEGETKVFSGRSENNSSHNFSSSQTSTRPKSGDQSGKPSLESNEEKSSAGPLNIAWVRSRQSSPEGKEIGGENKYYQNMSPGFDGIEQHKYKHSIESDRSDTRRLQKRPRGLLKLKKTQSLNSPRFLHSTNNDHGDTSKDSNLWEDKGDSNVIYNDRASESGDVSNAEFIGEKNTDSNTQQQDHGVEQGDVLDEVNGLGYPAHPILLSGQDMNQNGENVLLFSGHSSIFSNGFGSELDRPEACLDLHSQMLKGQNDAQTTELVPVITQSIENARKSPDNTETEITNLGNDTGEVGNLTQPDNAKVDDPGNSKPKQETALANPEAEEGNNNNKVARLFKNSLIEFVKEILKPTWKEGRLSRDVHKTIVKKVVDKVTSTVQEDHIPKTQEKVDQYLLFSKPKIGKLVQAYVERSLRTDS